MKRLCLGILALFLLVAPGLVAPLLAQQFIPPNGWLLALAQQQLIPPSGCLPEGQVHLDCLEYDNGGQCIHSKLWAECWNLATNEINRGEVHIITPPPGERSCCYPGFWHRWGLRGAGEHSEQKVEPGKH